MHWCVQTSPRAFSSIQPLIPPGDGHVQDALVGGEGETVGVLGVCSGVAQGAIWRDTVDTVEAELPFLPGSGVRLGR